MPTYSGGLGMLAGDTCAPLPTWALRWSPLL
jgi:glucan phosphorylase